MVVSKVLSVDSYPTFLEDSHTALGTPAHFTIKLKNKQRKQETKVMSLEEQKKQKKFPL